MGHGDLKQEIYGQAHTIHELLSLVEKNVASSNYLAVLSVWQDFKHGSQYLEQLLFNLDRLQQ